MILIIVGEHKEFRGGPYVAERSSLARTEGTIMGWALGGPKRLGLSLILVNGLEAFIVYPHVSAEVPLPWVALGQRQRATWYSDMAAIST